MSASRSPIRSPQQNENRGLIGSSGNMFRTGLRVCQTASTVEGWNESDFRRNGQIDSFGKDKGGSGTVVTAVHRNKGWMLSGHSDGVTSHTNQNTHARPLFSLTLLG